MIVSAWNIRIGLDELPSFDFLDVDSNFVDSIRHDGVIVPILVKKLPAGGYRVLAGRRRIEASRKAGNETVPAILADDSYPDDAVIELIENTLRSKNRHSDWMAVKSIVERVIQATGRPPTPRDVSLLTSVPIAKVKSVFRLFNVRHELLAAFEQGKIASSVIYLLAGMNSRQQEEALAIYEETGKLRLTDVNEIRKAGVVKAGTLLEGLDDLFPEPTDAPCRRGRFSVEEIIACAIRGLDKSRADAAFNAALLIAEITE